MKSWKISFNFDFDGEIRPEVWFVYARDENEAREAAKRELQAQFPIPSIQIVAVAESNLN